jgi:3-oxoacyl-[acyl-carrier-protein] synthase-3
VAESYWVTPLACVLGDERIDVRGALATDASGRLRTVERTGFEFVYHAGLERPVGELAIRAAQQAFEETTVRPDLLVVVSSIFPNGPGPGYEIAAKLDLDDGTRIVHLQDACTGFLQALDFCEDALASEASSSALVIVSDEYSRFMRSGDIGLRMLFSDAASAVLISKNRLNGNHLTRRWQRLGGARTALNSSQQSLKISGGCLEMNGAAVFQFAASHIPIILRRLQSQSIDTASVDKWYVHQGSRVVVENVARHLEVPAGSLFPAWSYGNVVGSAIPFQLFNAPPPAGSQTVGLLAFGMGLTAAAVVIRQDST